MTPSELKQVLTPDELTNMRAYEKQLRDQRDSYVNPALAAGGDTVAYWEMLKNARRLRGRARNNPSMGKRAAAAEEAASEFYFSTISESDRAHFYEVADAEYVDRGEAAPEYPLPEPLRAEHIGFGTPKETAVYSMLHAALERLEGTVEPSSTQAQLDAKNYQLLKRPRI